MNAADKPQKRDLTPLAWSDEELDALAGVEGFSAQQMAEAQAWGTPKTRALLAATEDDDERD